MGKRAELEQEAIRLYAEGKEVPAIAEALEVSENSLRSWKKRAGDEWDEARAAFRKGVVASMEDVGARLRRSREITERLSGDLKTQGDMGRILNEGIRTMIFDVMNQIGTTDLALDPEKMHATLAQIGTITLALNRAEAAAERNRKTAEEVKKLALAAAAATATNTLRKSGGASDELIERIRADILGIELT